MSKLGNSTEGADWEGCGEAWLCARPGGLPRAGGGRHRGGRGGVLPVRPPPDQDHRHVQEGVLVTRRHLAGVGHRTQET